MEKQFVEGFRVYTPHAKAPDFVVATGEIDVPALGSWLKGLGKEKVRIVMKKSQKGGFYMEVDNWEPKPKEESSDLPF